MEEKRRFPPGSGEIDIFALCEAARESTVKRRKLSGGRCTTECVRTDQIMAELEAARMLGCFTFNPIYVIGNKLFLTLLIGSSFSVNQGTFAKLEGLWPATYSQPVSASREITWSLYGVANQIQDISVTRLMPHQYVH